MQSNRNNVSVNTNITESRLLVLQKMKPDLTNENKNDHLILFNFRKKTVVVLSVKECHCIYQQIQGLTRGYRRKRHLKYRILQL